MKNKKVAQFFAGLMAAAMILTATPVTASAAAKSVTVKTQAQLNAALKNPKVTTIVIKTPKGITFKVKAGDYENKKLVIAAPKATVNNYGDFKKVSIHDAKVVYDRGAANQITVSDKNTLKLVAGKQSYESDITITSSGAKIIIVNNGEVDDIKVRGKSSVTVRGNAKEAPVITNDAENASIVAAMNASVVLNKSANVTVKSGCTLESLTTKADSAIKVEAGTTVKTLVVDGADSKIALTIDGKVEKIVVRKKADVSMSGATTSTVAVENNAAGTTIASEVKAAVSLNADATVKLEKGAEGSSVKTEGADVKAEVSNNTDQKVTLTDANGKDSTIDTGKTSDDATSGGDNTGDSTGGSTGGSTGSSSGGGSTGGSSETQKKNFGATATVDKSTKKVTVAMASVENAVFKINGIETTFTYSDTDNAYSATLSGDGRYTVTISADGYNDQTLEVVCDSTAPVITVDGDITAADVYLSDAATWTYASATVTDALDDTVQVVVTMKDSSNNDIGDVAAAREILETADNTVKVCYDATDASGNAATQHRKRSPTRQKRM